MFADRDNEKYVDGKRIGIMGGTFDPIHYGHLVIAEQVRFKYNLDKVIFIPTGNPPHKEKTKVTDNRHRYFMTLLATITNEDFKVSKIEIDKNNVSYTVNTLEEMKKLNPSAQFFFITGADAICQLDTWKDVRRLVKLCKFIAATRPGHYREDVKDKVCLLKEQFNADIEIIDVPALAISSTDIRNRIKNKESIKYLLPESVEYYIYKNCLY